MKHDGHIYLIKQVNFLVKALVSPFIRVEYQDKVLEHLLSARTQKWPSMNG